MPFLFEVCTKASPNYRSFSLNSPLVLSVASSPIPDFSTTREISQSNPITITGAKGVTVIVYFLYPYQVMEIRMKTSNKLAYFFARLEDQVAQINGVLVSSPSDTYFEYLITFVPPSNHPTKQVSLTIVTSKTTDITSLAITACTGNLFITNKPNEMLSFNYIVFY